VTVKPKVVLIDFFRKTIKYSGGFTVQFGWLAKFGGLGLVQTQSLSPLVSSLMSLREGAEG